MKSQSPRIYHYVRKDMRDVDPNWRKATLDEGYTRVFPVPNFATLPSIGIETDEPLEIEVRDIVPIQGISFMMYEMRLPDGTQGFINKSDAMEI